MSDLLYPGSPEGPLALLAAGKGRAVVFAPFCAAEATPDWAGNIELVDAETDVRRVQHVDRDLLERYASSYRRHFALWKEHGRRHSALTAQVPAEPDFFAALRAEALAGARWSLPADAP